MAAHLVAAARRCGGLAAWAVFLALPMAHADVAGDATVVYLVRHAEKTQDAEDPGLSTAGTERAEALAGLLVDAGVTAVHSAMYKVLKIS